ncbi:MAG: hypothetical protein HQ570_03635 [Candidatus Omnitrophica bacterium]|nr:hypothetical protein [Candidatus Omnitrophota bacterium]
MVFTNSIRKGIFLAFAVVLTFPFFLFFAYADDTGQPTSPCEECKASYVPGVIKVIDVLIIIDENCSFCVTQMPQELLKSKFPGIKFEAIDYKEKQAKELIAQYKIQTLPCFFIDPLIKEEKNFEELRFLFEEGETKEILLRKELAGMYLYLNRKEVKNKIDLFLDFYESGASEVLDNLISFSTENKINLDLHFVISQNKKAGYPKEEVRVALAIGELYPEEFNNYIYRRIKDIQNSSWIDTAEKEGLNYKEIRDLMISPVMDELISENKQLAEELLVSEGNVILIKNNRIFKISNVDKEELKSFFKEEGNNG